MDMPEDPDIVRVLRMLDPVRDRMASNQEVQRIMTGDDYRKMSSLVSRAFARACAHESADVNARARAGINAQMLRYYRESFDLAFSSISWNMWTRLLSMLFKFVDGFLPAIARRMVVKRLEKRAARVLFLRPAFRNFYFRCARQAYRPGGKGRKRDRDAFEESF